LVKIVRFEAKTVEQESEAPQSRFSIAALVNVIDSMHGDAVIPQKSL
jgi:hypothetical protein